MDRIYNKLVRDKIPDIIRAKGEEPVYRYIEDKNEYIAELEKKLKEECNEVISAKENGERLEELADLLEVIMALAGAVDSDIQEVIDIADEKARKRGGFEEGIFLEGVISNKEK